MTHNSHIDKTLHLSPPSRVILTMCVTAILVLICSQNIYAQSKKDSIVATYLLSEVDVRGVSGAGMSETEYMRLRWRVRRVWPYALLAAQYLEEIDRISVDMSRKKFRKEVTARQKELFDNFAGILKQFSRKEGQVLVKLIYRQTGISTYQIAKELKSGTRAFFWNATAGFFSISLKTEYNPQDVVEDHYIEQILREDFFYGALIYAPDYTDNLSYFCTKPNIVKK